MPPKGEPPAQRSLFPMLRRASHTLPPAHVDDDTPRAHYASPGTGTRRTTSDAPAGHEPTLTQEAPNMLLLVVLYMMQGVPLGLTMGALPLLLASKASFTQVRL